MALLNNPMGALVAVNRAATKVTGKPARDVVSGGDPRGRAPENVKVAPKTLADLACMTKHPVGGAALESCERYCKDNWPEMPCMLSCFHGSDGEGGCKLKTNCAACEDVPGDFGDLARVL